MLSLPPFGLYDMGSRVLDVGCGERPLVCADVLADVRVPRFVRRSRVPRHFVQCDIHRLPFADQSFTFAHCSHVLEHVADPGQACRELARVAHRGYIECPQSWLERVFCADDHRWLVDREGGALIFREKLPHERDDPLGVQYALFDWLRDWRFAIYWNLPQVARVRNVSLLWQRRIPLVVIDRSERRPRTDQPHRLRYLQSP